MATMRIIDGDGHVFEDADRISALMPSPYRELGPFGLRTLFPPLDHHHHYVGEHPPGSFRRNTGPAEWVEFMDDIGLESAVLYTTAGLAYGKITNRDWAIAVARAYNDWLYETYLQYSPRFKGIALVPLQEPDAAVEELRRAVRDLGMVGAMMPTTGLKAHLGSKEYWPVYREAEALGCCLGLHGGAHSGLGMDDMNVYTPVFSLGHPVGLMIGFGGIIYNGILDKFPNVRIGFMEGGAAWLALVLERFDRGHETHRQVDPRDDLQGPHPDEKASDYVIRHIKAGRLYVGCDGHEPALPYLVKVVGNEPFVYSSDFPHEVNNEMCKHEIGELIESDELTRADKEAILAGNAERFYRLAPAGATAAPSRSAATR
jgi:predicted TIM-barrel fold metal-dependent hydrolase